MSTKVPTGSTLRRLNMLEENRNDSLNLVRVNPEVLRRLQTFKIYEYVRNLMQQKLESNCFYSVYETNTLTKALILMHFWTTGVNNIHDSIFFHLKLYLLYFCRLWNHRMIMILFTVDSMCVIKPTSNIYHFEYHRMNNGI